MGSGLNLPERVALAVFVLLAVVVAAGWLLQLAAWTARKTPSAAWGIARRFRAVNVRPQTYRARNPL